MELDYAKAMSTLSTVTTNNTPQTKPLQKSMGPTHAQPNLWCTSFDGPNALMNTTWVQLNECCVLE